MIGLMAPARFVVLDVIAGARSRPARTMLSLVPLTVGCACLCLLWATLGGFEAKARRLIDDLGANVVGFMGATSERRGTTMGLDSHFAPLIRAAIPGSLVSTVRTDVAPTLGSNEPVLVIATDDDLLSVRQWRLIQGRFLDRRDVIDAERHVIITSKTRRDWRWRQGGTIAIGNVPFRIVGVLSMDGVPLVADIADGRLKANSQYVFVPNTVPAYWAGSPADQRDRVDAIFVRFPGDRPWPSGIERLRAILEEEGISPDQLSWATPESLTRRIERVRRSMMLLLGAISGFVLILGGATLASVVWSGVKERVPEIGLRRSIGGTSSDIMALFIIESAMLAAASGAGASTVANFAMSAFKGDLTIPLSVGWQSWLLPIVFCTLVAIAFAALPAWQASRLSPSEALRND